MVVPIAFLSHPPEAHKGSDLTRGGANFGPISLVGWYQRTALARNTHVLLYKGETTHAKSPPMPFCCGLLPHKQATCIGQNLAMDRFRSRFRHLFRVHRAALDCGNSNLGDGTHNHALAFALVFSFTALLFDTDLVVVNHSRISDRACECATNRRQIRRHSICIG